MYLFVDFIFAIESIKHKQVEGLENFTMLISGDLPGLVVKVKLSARRTRSANFQWEDFSIKQFPKSSNQTISRVKT